MGIGSPDAPWGLHAQPVHPLDSGSSLSYPVLLPRSPLAPEVGTRGPRGSDLGTRLDLSTKTQE